MASEHMASVVAVAVVWYLICQYSSCLAHLSVIRQRRNSGGLEAEEGKKLTDYANASHAEPKQNQEK